VFTRIIPLAPAEVHPFREHRNPGAPRYLRGPLETAFHIRRSSGSRPKLVPSAHCPQTDKTHYILKLCISSYTGKLGCTSRTQKKTIDIKSSNHLAGNIHWIVPFASSHVYFCSFCSSTVLTVQCSDETNCCSGTPSSNKRETTLEKLVDGTRNLKPFPLTKKGAYSLKKRFWS